MNWFELMNVDLPNLTSISNTGGHSFQYPLSVTLESTSNCWVLINIRYSQCPECQPTIFIPVGSIEIYFEYGLIDLNSFLDVAPSLADLVQ